MEQEKNNSKWVIALLIVIIVILAVLCVLFATGTIIFNNNSANSNEQSNQNEQLVSSIKIDDTKDYVYDASYSYDNKYQEYGDAKNEDGTPFTGTTHDGFNTTTWNNGKQYLNDLVVPYININTTDVAKINAKLQALYEEYAKIFDEHATSPIGGSQILKYYTYKSNNILSIVVTYGRQETDVLYPEYLTYNFDLSTGELLGYNDFLTKLGLTQNDCKQKLENKINNFDTLTIFKTKDEYNAEETINKLWEKDLLYFIDNNGNINYIVDIVVPAGRGSVSRLITIEK